MAERPGVPGGDDRAARLRPEQAERRLAVLDDIARSITASLDLDVVLERIAEGARQLCGSDTAALFLRQGDADVMVPRYRVGEFPANYETLRITPGQGLGGQAWTTGRPVRTDRYLDDLRIAGAFHDIARAIGAVAVMAVPIMLGDRVEGLLYLGRRSPRPFDAEDETIGSRLAQQAAIAIQNARLFARERRLRREAEVLAGLAAELTASLDLDRVLQRVAEAARVVCEAEVVRIALRDEGAEAMTYRYLVGTRATGYDALRLVAGQGFVGAVLRTGQPFRTADAVNDPAVHPEYGRWLIEAEGVRTALVVPIRSAGQVKGLIYTARRTPHPFTEEDERSAVLLADYAAIAIRNAESFRREQTARAEAEAAERRTSFLAQASILLSSSLDIEATLRSIARLAVPHLADFSAVDLLDERGAIRRLAVIHIDPDKEKAVRDLRERYGFNPDADKGVPKVLRTGQSAFVAEVTDENLRAAATSAEQLAALQALALRSWVIVPLAARGRILGALTFVMADSGRRYTAADVGMAEDLGRRAAIAIENAQLYREVQLTSQTKDEFLATVSHELRTPINAVYGWARMLRQAALDPVASGRALEVIERNARAQVHLIDDLLDVSRIVAGKMRLDVRPVEPAAAIEAALDAVRPAADVKGVYLHSVLDPRASPIMGDPDRLQQIVWNLLVNAVKFTPKGGRVQVTLRRVNSHVEIAVSDSGVGIPPDTLPLLFERFRQGQPGQGGLGIGLALVRHLAELHGGSVSARSEGQGRGAVFVVRFPVAIAAPSPALTAPALSPLQPGGDTRLDGVHVLVVDDDADSRELARTILELAGATVWTASSSVQAVDHLAVRRPHVILSDIEMPGVDGYTFVRRLRALPRDAGGTIPVVALTAYSAIQDRIRALDAGFDMHVPKPVDPSELRTVVARLARRGG